MNNNLFFENCTSLQWGKTPIMLKMFEILFPDNIENVFGRVVEKKRMSCVQGLFEKKKHTLRASGLYKWAIFA